MADAEDVFEFMIEHKIGLMDSQTVRQISHFFESNKQNPINLRKADKVFRTAIDQIEKELEMESRGDLKKELANLKHYYSRFCERMELVCEEVKCCPA